MKKPDVDTAINVANLPWSGTARCPCCGTALPFPDKPKRETRHTPGGLRHLLVDVRCSNCPASVTLVEDGEYAGEPWSFVPNQPLTVKRT